MWSHSVLIPIFSIVAIYSRWFGDPWRAVGERNWHLVSCGDIRGKTRCVLDFIKVHLDNVEFSERAEAIKKGLNTLCISILPEKNSSPVDRKKKGFVSGNQEKVTKKQQ